VKAGVSVQVRKFTDWLDANQHLINENGWINFDLLASQKTGNWYFAVNEWKPSVPATTAAPEPSHKDVTASSVPYPENTGPQPFEKPDDEINPEDIPF
jgi:hypothetical protein